ncbi:energy-coupling factor ABC transporter ATP-binding protein [Gracilinema caldarium]|uniref:Polyamine-transporting ATPase n=1 Tax=Gracilinema caldarium (strain ATCC 51460 / DSM 7334 / H1) TaxID=744872 RepID=F8F2R1_GRAC1|nr:ABC transporter ATP-binding protein [Gracilinema caldarium]AEJ19455.1 Polyamine-transporting ATPase [Gracilinema caldarium DSM 7334]
MSEPLYCIEKLWKRFPDGTEALKDINLELRDGTCTIIAGSNGSGKTLLMKSLVGLVDPSEGIIRYRGKPLREVITEVRQSVGLVFQDADAQIIGETVADDVAFGPKNLGLRGSELSFQVDEILKSLELISKKEAPPRRLSGGEKRRLAVAGILAMGCSTVIMDEPFANLDYPGIIQVLTLIMHLKQEGKTVLVLTHELEKMLGLADRLIILHKGYICDDGDPEKVLNRLKPEYGIRDPRQTYRSVKDCTWLIA